MEPEIARRCMNCGASVRGHARFCPQCGHAMSEAPTLIRRPTPTGGLVDDVERVARDMRERLTPVDAAHAPRDNDHPPAPHTDAPAEASRPTVVPAEVTHADDARAESLTAVEAQGVRRGRTDRARSRAGEGVERLREASFVVFDEAHDDPGLRFVLVAALLFALFLIILLLSHVLA